MGRTTELFIGLRSLFRLYDKMLKRVCTEHDLTLVEADIISFLRNNPEKDTAADIVELRMLSKGSSIQGRRGVDTEIIAGTDPGYGRSEKDPSETEASGGTGDRKY